VGAEALDPDLLADCSTTDQMAQSLRPSPLRGQLKKGKFTSV